MKFSSSAKALTLAVVAPTLARLLLLTAMKRVVPENMWFALISSPSLHIAMLLIGYVILLRGSPNSKVKAGLMYFPIMTALISVVQLGVFWFVYGYVE